MDKKPFGLIAVVLIIFLAFWVFGGTKINCRKSFWDKDNQTIETKYIDERPK